MSQVPRKDGWLTKQKAKRFFVCEGTSLCWMDNPQAPVNGSLDLRDYFVELRDKGGKSAEIVLTPKQRGGSTAFAGRKQKAKKYVLGDRNQSNVAAWYGHLDRVLKSQLLLDVDAAAASAEAAAQSPTTSQQLPGDLSASSGKRDSDLPPSSAPPRAPGSESLDTCPSRAGWLEKKGQRRYFVLRDGVLYWFSKEIRPGSDLVAAGPNGSVDLTACEITRGPSQQQPKHSTAFNVTYREANGELYVITAKTDEDAHQWFLAMAGAAQWAKNQLETLRVGLAAIPPSEVTIRGNMKKKGDLRFFMIKNQQLSWWDSERAAQSGDANPNGSIRLAGATVAEKPGKPLTILIVNTCVGFKYSVTANKKMQFDQWMAALSRACAATSAATALLGEVPAGSRLSLGLAGVTIGTGQAALAAALEANEADSLFNKDVVGWMVKKGKRRFFVLRDGVLMWFTTEGEAVLARRGDSKTLPRNTLALAGCKVSLGVDGFTLTIVSSTARSYRLTVPTAAEGKKWQIALLAQASTELLAQGTTPVNDTTSSVSLRLTGFAEKKGQNRYFCADAAEGTLSWWLSETAASSGKTAKNFLALAGSCVTKSDDRSLLVIQARGEPYKLTYGTQEDRDRWLASLQCCIANANASVEAGYRHSGWLEKKGSRRWFVLTSDALLLWFDQAQPFRYITRSQANGFLQIGSPIAEQAPDVKLKYDTQHPTEFSLESKRNGTYKLKTKTREECEGWVSAIRAAGTVRTASALVGGVEPKCFGRPISELAADSDSLPFIISNATIFILAHGSGLQGVFRLSAGAEKIREFRLALNADSAATPWSGDVFDDTVHAVAASLKALLREMPVPLIPSELYSVLLRVNPHDPNAIAAILRDGFSKAAPCVYASVKCLGKFMSDFSKYSGTTNMDSGNLAIVFGPNILRLPDNDQARNNPMAAMSGLADTPQVLSVVRTFIERFDIIWPIIEAGRGGEVRAGVGSTSEEPVQVSQRPLSVNLVHGTLQRTASAELKKPPGPAPQPTGKARTPPAPPGAPKVTAGGDDEPGNDDE